MGEDVPNRGDIAVFDVDGTEQEGDAEGEGVEFDDGERDEQPREAGGDTVDEGEDDDDTEVDGRLMRAVAVAETTTMYFGKLILRRRSPRATMAWMPWPVHSVKKFQRTVPVRR